MRRLAPGRAAIPQWDGQTQSRHPRQALSSVLQALRRAASSEAQKLVITMGDDLVREIGQDIHQLPH